LAVAVLLAERGAGVVVNGRDADAAAEAASGIEGAVAYAGSPADPPTADALIGSCIAEFGRIDILVNCAGTAGLASESILEVSSEQFRDLIHAHLVTTFETCRAAAPRMVAQGGGAIVNTSSFAFLGDYGGTGYPAGKGGVNGLTLALAAELKEHGVRANVVCPGAKTRLSTGPEYEAHIGALSRRGLLDDVSTERRSMPRPRSMRRRYTPTSPAMRPKTSRAESSSVQADSSVNSRVRRPPSSATATTGTRRRGPSTNCTP
jgi:NAD(P)-dependent dehydrogenase (short-subunit alcohol dehydrogenase family)